jgi:hypothetical protein
MKPLMRMGGANVEHVHELYIPGVGAECGPDTNQ